MSEIIIKELTITDRVMALYNYLRGVLYQRGTDSQIDTATDSRPLGSNLRRCEGKALRRHRRRHPSDRLDLKGEKSKEFRVK